MLFSKNKVLKLIWDVPLVLSKNTYCERLSMNGVLLLYGSKWGKSAGLFSFLHVPLFVSVCARDWWQSKEANKVDYVILVLLNSASEFRLNVVGSRLLYKSTSFFLPRIFMYFSLQRTRLLSLHHVADIIDEGAPFA